MDGVLLTELIGIARVKSGCIFNYDQSKAVAYFLSDMTRTRLSLFPVDPLFTVKKKMLKPCTGHPGQLIMLSHWRAMKLSTKSNYLLFITIVTD